LDCCRRPQPAARQRRLYGIRRSGAGATLPSGASDPGSEGRSIEVYEAPVRRTGNRPVNWRPQLPASVPPNWWQQSRRSRRLDMARRRSRLPRWPWRPRDAQTMSVAVLFPLTTVVSSSGWRLILRRCVPALAPIVVSLERNDDGFDGSRPFGEHCHLSLRSAVSENRTRSYEGGFFADFRVSPSAQRVTAADFCGGDAVIQVQGLHQPAACILYIENGELSVLPTDTGGRCFVRLSGSTPSQQQPSIADLESIHAQRSSHATGCRDPLFCRASKRPSGDRVRSRRHIE
jgi:hypothetical protein